MQHTARSKGGRSKMEDDAVDAWSDGMRGWAFIPMPNDIRMDSVIFLKVILLLLLSAKNFCPMVSHPMDHYLFFNRIGRWGCLFCESTGKWGYLASRIWGNLTNPLKGFPRLFPPFFVAHLRSVTLALMLSAKSINDKSKAMPSCWQADAMQHQR